MAGAVAIVSLMGVMVFLLGTPSGGRPTYRGLPAVVPEAAQPSDTGARYVNLPTTHIAALYRSPLDGGLLAEWPGGTSLHLLGRTFFDQRTDWLLVRDPVGNEGWVAALFLDERYTAMDPPTDREYLGAVWWAGQIAICVNPRGGPPGLDGEAFVALVERAASRWQEVADGRLPLVSSGRCDDDPWARGDGVNAVGWADDLGLAIAGLTWPNASQGVVSEMDVVISRGFFERLHARDPSKTIPACVFSTMVHELGHVLGLDHPRARLLPSSMQGFGASRCDKGQPSVSDRENLLLRYGR